MSDYEFDLELDEGAFSIKYDIIDGSPDNILVYNSEENIVDSEDYSYEFIFKKACNHYDSFLSDYYDDGDY